MLVNVAHVNSLPMIDTVWMASRHREEPKWMGKMHQTGGCTSYVGSHIISLHDIYSPEHPAGLER